jgi:hypothetical protein
MSEKCGLCKFFKEYPNDIGGVCKRYPPMKFVGDNETGDEAISPDYWTNPAVEDVDWCGEFSPRVDA